MAGTPYRDPLLDHSYDGIQEFDNPTPGWWWWMFHGTIAFSIVYFIFYQFSPMAWTIQKAHEEAKSELMRQKFGEIGELQPDAATITEYMHKDEWLSVGASVFSAKCAACHGANAEGLVGPNLTDDYYKNVKSIEDIANVVTNGAAGNAMPAWKQQLHPNEIVLVSSYVASLRGEDLVGPRGPEGEEIPPWPEYTPSTEDQNAADTESADAPASDAEAAPAD